MWRSDETLHFYEEPANTFHRGHQQTLRQILNNSSIPTWIHQTPPTVICCVPSTRGRAHHPLPNIIASVLGPTVEISNRLTLAKTRKGQPGFDTSIAPHTSVVVTDDAYTTGATLQAAISTLRRPGAVITCAIVIGHRINPNATPQLTHWWDTHTAFRPNTLPHRNTPDSRQKTRPHGPAPIPPPPLTHDATHRRLHLLCLTRQHVAVEDTTAQTPPTFTTRPDTEDTHTSTVRA